MPSPRLSAASSSVNGTDRPSPKSMSPCSSNQSMPDLTWTRISCAVRNAEPSASTCHPSADQHPDGAAELGDGNRVIGAGGAGATAA